MSRAKRIRRGALRVAVELVIVFVGVYGAFLLNEYRADRQDDERRHQIYRALLTEVQEIGRNTDSFIASFGPGVERFEQALEAGEMPRPSPVFFTVSYTPHMWNATLQSEGLDVLELDVLYEVSGLYNNLEMAFGMLEELQTLSKDVLMPSLNADLSEFYDLETKQLRAKYRWYLHYSANLMSRANLIQREADSLEVLLHDALDS
jgi:hypothetical protein